MTAAPVIASGRGVEGVVRAARSAQREWAALPLRSRLVVLKALRHRLARAAGELATAAASPDHGTRAEAIAAEVVPLLDALAFLEHEAATILSPRRHGRRGRPRWLGRLISEVHREPHGVVLVVAPANYPLLLAGVQIAQALAAGNAVVVKPAPAGVVAASRLAAELTAAGLPPGVLQTLPSDPAAVGAALAAGVDHLIVTGSSTTGRTVLELAARHGVAATAELSGCDAVFVLDDADLDRTADALAFGLRLNGGRTCCAPRRVLVAGERQHELAGALLRRIGGWRLPIAPAARAMVSRLVGAAEGAGARRVAGALPEWGPVVLVDARPTMELLQSDVGAPLLAMVPVEDELAALAADASCPFHLGAAIFGSRRRAQALADRVRAGLVTIDDVIVPSADPRLPFGGRDASGFGVTRGVEGLLAMTVPKVVAWRGRGRLRHLLPPRDGDDAVLAALTLLRHGGAARRRVRGLRDLLAAVRRAGAPGSERRG